MRRRAALLSALAVFAGAPASAQTLEEALSLAYETNPTIGAERARQRATKQQKMQAIARALPQVQAEASYLRTDSEGMQAGRDIFGRPTPPQPFDREVTTTSYRVSATQPLFAGLRNFNAIRAAKSRVKAGNAQLALVEQDVLQRAAEAYFNVVRDMRVYEATKNNVDVLLRQKREAELRFEVGEVTKTDVAQADARLAQSRAQLTTAQARLAVSRAGFKEIVGSQAVTLERDPGLPPTPDSLEQAKEIAAIAAPLIARARMTEEASRRDFAVAKGAFSPTISVIANYENSDQPSNFVGITESDEFAYGVRATMPIFLGGLNISRAREAQALNEADRERIEEAERRSTAQVTQAWEQLTAARANIVSATAQVDANELALTGVRREAQLGTRTTLDVLDAEQEYLNSQVALANAERDARSATFLLLAAMGGLGPEGANSESDGDDSP